MFVGGLSYATTSSSLGHYFSSLSPITACAVMSDPSSQRSRGFGFVTFSSAAGAGAVVDRATQGGAHVVDGKQVDVKFAVARERMAPPDPSRDKGGAEQPPAPPGHAPPGPAAAAPANKLFAGGLHFATTDRSFLEYFAGFGQVASALVVLSRETGKSRGFGFVTFRDDEATERVL
ncbi:hypothetical protein TeGR_g601, partial [Tetraparma gracilis]